jgi:hypothetical protein
MTRATINLFVTAAVACKTPAPAPAPAQLVDLTGSVDALRTEFDAHAQEARFLTLLAPT